MANCSPSLIIWYYTYITWHPGCHTRISAPRWHKSTGALDHPMSKTCNICYMYVTFEQPCVMCMCTTAETNCTCNCRSYTIKLKDKIKDIWWYFSNQQTILTWKNLAFNIKFLFQPWNPSYVLFLETTGFDKYSN